MKHKTIIVLLICALAGTAIVSAKLSFASPNRPSYATGPTQVAPATEPSAGREALRLWQAGREVSEADVKSYGLKRCFAADTLSDAVFQRMQGKSYKQGCIIARSDLRYVRVLHRTLDDRILLGEIVCHRTIAGDLVSIFRTLYDAHYPIERMQLIDEYDADDEHSMTDNNTTCFNYRPIHGGKKLSYHSQGKAIDINPLYNPYVRQMSDGTTNVAPKAGQPYVDRSRSFAYKIDKTDLCYREFLRHGFEWGGNWHSLKDYQHFEKH